MKIRNTITKLITLAIAMTALAVIGSSRTTGRTAAQTNSAQSALATAPVGFVSGETLRFSVFNPNALEQGGEPVRVRTFVYDSLGRLAAQTGPVTIAPGQFYSFDYNRDALPAAGEPGTGRLQVRGRVEVLLGDGSVRSLTQNFLVSVEVIDNRSGKTSSGGNYFAGTVSVSGDGFGE